MSRVSSFPTSVLPGYMMTSSQQTTNQSSNQSQPVNPGANQSQPVNPGANQHPSPNIHYQQTTGQPQYRPNASNVPVTTAFNQHYATVQPSSYQPVHSVQTSLTGNSMGLINTELRQMNINPVYSSSPGHSQNAQPNLIASHIANHPNNSLPNHPINSSTNHPTNSIANHHQTSNQLANQSANHHQISKQSSHTTAHLQTSLNATGTSLDVQYIFFYLVVVKRSRALNGLRLMQRKTLRIDGISG